MALGEEIIGRRVDAFRGSAGETLNLVPGEGVFRERLAGVDADDRRDLRFFAGVAG